MHSRLLLLALFGLIAAQAHANPGRATAALAALPGWFEPNAGQFPRDVAFFSRGSAGTLLVERAGATFKAGGRSLELRWNGASASGSLQGAAPTAARSSYLTGADPKRWAHAIPQYSRVQRRQIYPGIDVVYYVAGQQVEFDLVVAPGADPNRINLSFARAGKPKMNAEGDLVFANGMVQRRPITYQETAGGRVPVDSQYRVAKDGSISFTLGDYDRGLPLVIDPILHAGYLGGEENDRANAIAVDRQGNVWIAGSSYSVVTAPDQNAPIQDAPQGRRDAFLARLTPDASGNLALSYWTQLGGADDDEATSIAVDNSGFVYIAGYTASTNFPGAGVKLQENFGGLTDAFAARIRIGDSGPEALWFSQTYGGTGTDIANAIAIDSSGAMYIAGYSDSDVLPGALNGGLQCCRRGGYDGFFVKISPDSATSLAYASYLGGESTDVIKAIGVDAAGDVYLAGYTFSGNFPVTSDAYRIDLWNMDGFLVKVDLRRPLLDALVYSTFIGGGNSDLVQALTIAPNGDVWIGGYTASADFPVTANAHSTSNSGDTDIFLVRFDAAKGASPDAVAYSTYLGGSNADVLYSLAPGPNGSVALAGYTYSANFPVTDTSAAGAGPIRSAEALLVQLNPGVEGAGAIEYSVVLGGRFIDTATGVAVDAAGNLYATGFSTSFDFPVTDGSTKLSRGGATQSLLLRTVPAAPAEE